LSHLTSFSYVNQRERFGLSQRIEREVDVEIGPVEMVFVEEFHREDLIERGLSEPRKTLIRQKVLSVVDQEPDSVSIDIGNFNAGSAYAMR
jgi:hypothetical protein